MLKITAFMSCSGFIGAFALPTCLDTDIFAAVCLVAVTISFGFMGVIRAIKNPTL
jgi:hypothetical protein